jgi:predicted alpha/beta-fold hydrolase
MQLLGDLILIPVYALLPGEVPKLGYSRTHQNLRILERCPTLKYFKQTAWLNNPYLAMGVLMYRDLTEAGSRAILEIDRELLKTPDGGVIALDWWTSIPEGMVPDKVLVIGSTFTGDALPATQQDICKHFSARGWRCVIIVKRGCGLTMPNLQPESTTSKPWCFSNFDDTNLAINHVADKFPDLPVCGLGLSCGAAQLRNYVYMTGEHSRLNACVVIDAAESWVEAVPSIDHRQPLISKILSIAAARSFQNCNMPNADQWTDSVLDFTRKCMAPAHGFDMDCMSYFWSCQPADPAGCRVPVLELASYNDVLIDVPGVKDLSNLHMASPHVVNCTTRSGTHIIRWQGLRPQDWLSVVACEFLEASLSTVAEESATTIQ